MLTATVQSKVECRHKVIAVLGLVLSAILLAMSIYDQKWLLAFGYLCGLIFCIIIYVIQICQEYEEEVDAK